MMDLISAAVGGHVVECNDEFFAEAENLIRISDAVWREDEYTNRGKWMDGWETRRRRDDGFDWCVLALGIPGRVDRVTVDTAHFTGNYPEEFSLDACGIPDGSDLVGAAWTEVIPRSGLKGDSSSTFDVAADNRITHLRLNIYPDGGVARLRVEGTPIPDAQQVCSEGVTDLATSLVGGVALAASDLHYSPPSNLLRPTDSVGMWDGWETKRRRGPGHDWAVFRLGLPGHIEALTVDTSHFRGNSPGWVSFDVSEDGEAWSEVMARAPVEPDTVSHVPLLEAAHGVYVRLSIHPDGGLARLRVLGRADPASASELRLTYLNSLFDPQAEGFFSTACASSRWVDEMLAHRPYETVADVLATAETSFDRLGDDDWLEAFAGHPRIGETGDATSQREQAGALESADATKVSLAEINAQYEAKFGFLYLVHASGKTGPQLLAIARSRLDNEREEEVVNASRQQRLITSTRLSKMLCLESA